MAGNGLEQRDCWAELSRLVVTIPLENHTALQEPSQEAVGQNLYLFHSHGLLHRLQDPAVWGGFPFPLKIFIPIDFQDCSFFPYYFLVITPLSRIMKHNCS